MPVTRIETIPGISEDSDDSPEGKTIFIRAESAHNFVNVNTPGPAFGQDTDHLIGRVVPDKSLPAEDADSQ